MRFLKVRKRILLKNKNKRNTSNTRKKYVSSLKDKIQVKKRRDMVKKMEGIES